MIQQHEQHDQQTDRPTDRQHDMAWDHVVRREEHPLHSGAWSLCFSLCTAWAGLACSPTDCAIGSLWLDPCAHGPLLLAQRTHCMLRLALRIPLPACLLAYACLLFHTGSIMARCWLIAWLSRLFACLNGRNGCTGLEMAPAGILGTLCARMHGTGMTGMATETRRSPVESDWHAD